MCVNPSVSFYLYRWKKIQYLSTEERENLWDKWKTIYPKHNDILGNLLSALQQQSMYEINGCLAVSSLKRKSIGK